MVGDRLREVNVLDVELLVAANRCLVLQHFLVHLGEEVVDTEPEIAG